METAISIVMCLGKAMATAVIMVTTNYLIWELTGATWCGYDYGDGYEADYCYGYGSGQAYGRGYLVAGAYGDGKGDGCYG